MPTDDRYVFYSEVEFPAEGGSSAPDGVKLKSFMEDDGIESESFFREEGWTVVSRSLEDEDGPSTILFEHRATGRKVLAVRQGSDGAGRPGRVIRMNPIKAALIRFAVSLFVMRRSIRDYFQRPQTRAAIEKWKRLLPWKRD